MTDLVAQSCGCEHTTWMGQKRPERCEHGNFFVSVNQAQNRGSSLKQGKGFAASPAQREKVKGLVCVNCGRARGEYLAIDSAHLTARGMGGCGDPRCVIPLCREGGGKGCHRLFDEGKLDILSLLVERGYFAEMAHAVEAHQLSPLTVVKNTTGLEYGPVAPLQRELETQRARIVELEGLAAA